MMKWHYLFFTFLVMSIFLAACSASDSVEFSCDDFQEDNHRSGNVSVNVGDEFTMTLCSNPTTGYSWSEDSEISATGVVEQIGHEYVAPEEGDQPPIAGKGGEEVWRFKALEVGDSSITVEYSQPWDGGEKGTWTLVLNVTVK